MPSSEIMTGSRLPLRPFISPAAPPVGPPAPRLARAPRPLGPAGQLSDAALLALVLGAGATHETAHAQARAVLAHFGDLTELGRAEPSELLSVPGLKAPRRAGPLLAACLELGRRSAGRRPLPGQRLAAASEVYAHYRARFASASAEEFWVLGLDVRHRLIFETCIARGSLTGVEVHPREVYRPLIRGAAAAALFCHNHPSGDPTPSRQDLELTARLKDVGALCGITVLDHVVVAAEGYVSLAERGWL
jgi:DNA repair protein RadC